MHFLCIIFCLFMLTKGQMAQWRAGRLIRHCVWEVRGSTHASNIFYFFFQFPCRFYTPHLLRIIILWIHLQPDPAHLTFWGLARALWSHPLDPSPSRSNATLCRSTMSPQKMVSWDQAPDSGPSFWGSEVQRTPPRFASSRPIWLFLLSFFNLFSLIILLINTKIILLN